MITKRIAALNSLLFIRDPTTDDIPEISDIAPFWVTPSCLAVCCRPDCDGDTEVTIGTVEEMALARIPDIQIRLRTPSRKIQIETVGLEPVIEIRVRSSNTQIQIWTNDGIEPDKVIIAVD